jgi:hypothetical protein
MQPIPTLLLRPGWRMTAWGELFTCMPLWKIDQTSRLLKSCFAPLWPTSSSTIPVCHSVSVPFVLWRSKDQTRGSHVEKCPSYPWVHNPHAEAVLVLLSAGAVPPRRGSRRHSGEYVTFLFFFLILSLFNFSFLFFFVSIFFLFVFHVAGSAFFCFPFLLLFSFLYFPLRLYFYFYLHFFFVLSDYYYYINFHFMFLLFIFFFSFLSVLTFYF